MKTFTTNLPYMEINNLLTQIKKTPTDTKKYLAIEIGRETIKTASWEVSGIQPTLLATGTIEEYSQTKPDQLVTAVDNSLSKSLSEIDPEPDEVIFSLPESWVNGSAITTEKKPLLKHLTSKLDLKPVGFVVTIEAIIHYLKTKHGGPFTGIIVEVTEQEVVVTLVKNGSIIEIHSVGRSEDLGSDVEEGIARFKSLDSLPANMVLYDGHTNLETQKQELITYDWQEKLPFLHIPKIDTFSPDESIKAVVQSGGAEVIKSLEIPNTSDDEEPDKDEKETDVESEKSSHTPPPQKTKNKKPSQMPDLSEEFGFSSDIPESDNFTPAKTEDIIHPEDSEDHTSDIDDESEHDSDQQTDTKSGKFKLPSFNLSILRKIIPSRPTISFSKKNSLLLIVVASIITISVVSAMLAAYWYLPTAQVTILVTPKTLDTNLEFTIDANLDQPDLFSNTIPGRIVQAQDETEVQTAATGTKTVGEFARGQVTIYNRSDSSTTLPSGTKIIGPDSLTYTIDQAITVASASTKAGNNKYEEIKTPSTAKVATTAVGIGAQYNLGQGTELSVSEYSTSSLIAEAASDISGGSSREVTAISEDDLITLREQARTQLESQIADQYSSQDDIIGAIVLDQDQFDFNETFSGDIGDESPTLSLQASLTANVMTYTFAHVQHLIEQQLIDSTPDKYRFVSKQSDLEIISHTSIDDQTLQVVSKAQAQLLPMLDDSQIKTNIQGRYPSVTEEYFQSLPSFSKSIIDIRPKWLPPFLKTFPRIEENITITIQTN
ncbi:hypothetical protein ACFL2V_13680 [Pseudomonadota bacterium]